MPSVRDHEHLCKAPAAEESSDRKCSLVAPFPPGVEFWSHKGKPPILIRRDLKGYKKSGRLRLHTHIGSSTPIAGAPTRRVPERNSVS